MVEFFNSIMSGERDFPALISYIKDLLLGYWGTVSSIIASYGMIAVAVLIVVGLVALLYGKKFFGLAKFIVCAAAGYFVGTLIVSPMINTLFAIPELACGIILALICGVLYKFIYVAILYGGAGILSFVLFFSNGIIPIVLPTQGNKLLSAVGVAVVLLIMLLARKNIDRLVTSLFGACCIAYAVKKVFDYTAFAPDYATYIKIGVIAVLALIGFCFQYRRRKRY